MSREAHEAKLDARTAERREAEDQLQRDLMRRARREAQDHLAREAAAGIKYDEPPPGFSRRSSSSRSALLQSTRSAQSAASRSLSRPDVSPATPASEPTVAPRPRSGLLQRASSFASSSPAPLCDARSRRALERFRARSFDRRQREPAAPALAQQGAAPAEKEFRLLLRAQQSRGAWREYSLRDIRTLPPIELRGGRRLHVAVRQRGCTRVLVVLDQPQPEAPLRMALSARLQLRVSIEGVGLVLLDQDGASGQHQELVHAAVRGAKLHFDASEAASELRLQIDHVQLDNMLPSARHSVLLLCPSRAHSERCSRSGGASRSDAACRLVVLARAAEFERVSLELVPLDVAVEASLLVRLGRLASDVRAASVVGCGHAAVRRCLGATLQEPPDFFSESQREPLYLAIGILGATVTLIRAIAKTDYQA